MYIKVPTSVHKSETFLSPILGMKSRFDVTLKRSTYNIMSICFHLLSPTALDNPFMRRRRVSYIFKINKTMTQHRSCKRGVIQYLGGVLYGPDYTISFSLHLCPCVLLACSERNHSEPCEGHQCVMEPVSDCSAHTGQQASTNVLYGQARRHVWGVDWSGKREVKGVNWRHLNNLFCEIIFCLQHWILSYITLNCVLTKKLLSKNEIVTSKRYW